MRTHRRASILILMGLIPSVVSRHAGMTRHDTTRHDTNSSVSRWRGGVVMIAGRAGA